jgi:hypothetical protein
VNNVNCGAPNLFQIGPIIRDLPYETFNTCTHTELYAQVQRQTKSKATPNQQMIREFTEFVVHDIKTSFTKAVGYPKPWSKDCFNEAVQLINERGLTAKVRDAYINELEELMNARGRVIRTNTDAFIKREVVFGSTWPRLIAARQNALRNLSAVPYKYVEA